MSAINHVIVIAIVVFFNFGAWGYIPADSIDCIAQKNILMEKLDSIEMEKQIRKRQGLSLDELEKKTLWIKDSIAALKNNIKRTNGSSPAAAALHESSKRISSPWQISRFLPRNAFDWAVCVLAAVALIAGVLLCVGLFSMLGKAIKNGKKTPMKNVGERISQRGKHALKESPLPMENADAGISEDKIDSIKKRIDEELRNPDFPEGMSRPEKGNFQPKAIAPIDFNKERIIPSPLNHDASPTAADLKAQIIKAGLEGADVSEISKRFHIGADQVSLILRVSQQKNDNKG